MKRKIRYVSLISQPEPEPKPKKGSRAAQVIAFIAFLAVGMTVSLIIPLRPSVSASEKRELAKFPEFSFEALAEGDYFDKIDTWFSDTFPFRETLTGINTRLTSWYGFGDRVSSMTDDIGDEIPDVPTRPADNENLSDNENTTQSTSTETTEAAQSTTEKVTEKPDKNESDKTAQPKKTQTLGGVLVAGKAGYEYYNFIQSTADAYIKAVNRASKKLGSKVKVYDLIIPTSIDITLDDATRKNVSSSNQKKAIEYFYSSMRKSVKTTDVFDTLRVHRDEYIYFRTDHHWTALGAYYAYRDLMKTAGKTPVNIEKFKKVSYGEFLGSFYNDTKQNKKLRKNADELIAYKPYYSTSMTFTDNKGKKYNWPLINDVSGYNISYKYSCFAAGDQPYVKITNNDIKKKTSCVVIKESFANAMIPFIAGNYRKVYVIDYRYWKGNLYSFIDKKAIKDVFFINNMSATRNKSLVESLTKLCR